MNKRLAEQLKNAGASKREAKKLAELATLLGDITPPGLSDDAKQEILAATVGEPKAKNPLWWLSVGATATAAFVFVFVFYSSKPSSDVYYGEGKTPEQSENINQPNNTDSLPMSGDALEKKALEPEQPNTKEDETKEVEEREKKPHRFWWQRNYRDNRYDNNRYDLWDRLLKDNKDGWRDRNRR